MDENRYSTFSTEEEIKMRQLREFTVHEAAQFLRITEPALRCAIARGQCPVVRRLGRVRVTPEGIQEFVRARTR